MTLMGICVILVGMSITQGIALADPDPTGAATIEENPNAAVNFTWTLVAAFLVFFMQAGFALLEAGSVRARSTANVLTKNVVDFLMCGMAFWAFGFAIMFGGSELASGLDDGNDLFGSSGFFLTGDAYDVSTMELWFLQMVFAATAATIVSGTMAERTKINAYMAYSFLISAIIYPVNGHWAWGGGWLATMDTPFRDFAGSGVLHTVGGTAALVGGLILGPRMGKFGPDGKARAIPGHSMTLVVLGMLILYLGWFGFNPGSTWPQPTCAYPLSPSTPSSQVSRAVSLPTTYASYRQAALTLRRRAPASSVVWLQSRHRVPSSSRGQRSSSVPSLVPVSSGNRRRLHQAPGF